MAVSRDQNAGRIHSMKIDNSSIERLEELRGSTVLLEEFLFRSLSTLSSILTSIAAKAQIFFQ